MTDTPEPWTASISALGPITQLTPLTVETLTPLLPGYDVKSFDSSAGAIDTPSIGARRGAPTNWCLQFVGHESTDKIVTVRVYEPGRIPNAFMIGSKFSETLLKRDRCFRGEGRQKNYINCTMENEPWLLYWISSKAITDDDTDTLPSEGVLNDAEIVFISWIPWRAPDEAIS